jgi:hypothetical protein
VWGRLSENSYGDCNVRIELGEDASVQGRGWRLGAASCAVCGSHCQSPCSSRERALNENVVSVDVASKGHRHNAIGEMVTE